MSVRRASAPPGCARRRSVGLAASAPYLHNGSVPSLRALLEPPSKRPVTFPLGKAGFVFDTRLPGNGNQGHDFGSALTAGRKVRPGRLSRIALVGAR